MAGGSNQSPSTTQSRDTADGQSGIAGATVGGILLQPKTVGNEKLTLLFPQGFSIMGEEMLSLKSPRQRRPTLVKTDETGAINLAINHTKDRMRQSSIGTFHREVEDMF